MQDQDLFQQLKLRASYGVTGNQAIGSYETLRMLQQLQYGWGTSTNYTGYWSNLYAGALEVGEDVPEQHRFRREHAQ